MTIFCGLEAQSIFPAAFSNKVVFLLNLRWWQHPLSSDWGYFFLSVLPFILFSESPSSFFIILCPFSNMTSALLVPLALLLRPKPLAMRFLSESRLISWMYFTSVRSFMLVQKSSMFSLYIYFTPLIWHVRNVFVHLLPSFNKEGKRILLLTKFKNKTQTYSYMVLIWFVKYVLEEIRLLPGLIHCVHFFLIHKMWRSCTASYSTQRRSGWMSECTKDRTLIL